MKNSKLATLKTELLCAIKKKTFWKSYAVDVLAVTLIVLIYFAMSAAITQELSYSFGDLSIDEMQTALLAGDEAVATALQNSVAGFFYMFITTLITGLLLWIATFVYSQKIIWEHLLLSKVKSIKLTKRFLFSFLLATSTLLLIVFLGLIKQLLFQLTLGKLNLPIAAEDISAINGIFDSFIVLISVFMFQLGNYVFQKERKVWVSVGELASHLNSMKKPIILSTILMTVFFLIVNAIIKLILYYTISPGVYVTTIFTVLILLFFAGLQRVYILKKFNKTPTHHKEHHKPSKEHSHKE